MANKMPINNMLIGLWNSLKYKYKTFNQKLMRGVEMCHMDSRLKIIYFSSLILWLDHIYFMQPVFWDKLPEFKQK